MNADYQPKLIAFDLDGTLVDSAPDLHASVNAMQQQLGGPARSQQQVRAWIGNGVERLVQRALTGVADGDAEGQLFTTAMTLFEQAYQHYNGSQSQLFPGVKETLQTLSAQDYRLVCVTNKPARFTEPLLRTLNLQPYFLMVVSGDSLTHKKPHPQPLLHAAQQCGVEAADCLLIGDSITDIKAARAAGFAVVCVSYGYNQGEAMHSLNGSLQADAVIDSLTEMACLLNLPASSAPLGPPAAPATT